MAKIISTVGIALFCLGFSCAQDKQIFVSHNEIDKAFYLVNGKGKVLSKAYDYMEEPRRQRSLVVGSFNKLGAISRKGEEIIPCNFLHVDIYDEWIFAYDLVVGHFFDHDGNLLYKKELYYNCHPLSKQLTKCSYTAFYDLFLRSDGSEIDTFNINYTSKMKDGLIPVQTLKTRKFGYLDSLGNLAIDSTFNFADNFDEGYARVLDQEGHTFLIDESGKAIKFPKGYFYHTHFDEFGLLSKDGNSYRIYNLETEKWLTEMTFKMDKAKGLLYPDYDKYVNDKGEEIRYFAGLLYKGQSGVIDENGIVIEPFEHDFIHSKYGYINVFNEGEDRYIFSLENPADSKYEYSEKSMVSNGMGKEIYEYKTSDKKRRYLYPSGELSQASETIVTSTKGDGLFYYIKQTTQPWKYHRGVLNEKGGILVEAKYNSVELIPGKKEFYKVGGIDENEQEKFGLFDNMGRRILSMNYDEIEVYLFEDNLSGLLVTKENNKYRIRTLSGKYINEIEYDGYTTGKEGFCYLTKREETIKVRPFFLESLIGIK